MTANWKIGDWGTACGPKPSGTGGPAGTVTITQQGAELAMSGAGRTYSTRECWEQFPGLGVTSHSAGSRTWRNTCRTPPGDPRQAHLVTTITATNTQIAFDETGQYQFVIKGQNCTASVRRTRFLRPLAPSVGSARPTTPAASAAPQATGQKSSCRTPGPPARLEVRPSRKLMRAGESYAFHALVMDARGCAVGASPTFRVVGEPTGVSVSESGRVDIPAATPEGEVKLIASAGGRSVAVAVEVVSRERYDALLAEGRFDPSGASEEAAVVKLESSSIGAKETVVKDDAERNRTLFVALVGAAALILGLVGLALVQRSRRANRRARSTGPTSQRVPASARSAAGTMVCPTCRDELPAGAQFCPKDGNRLMPLSSSGDLVPSGAVCPVCGQGFDPGVSICPKHEEPLVPPAVYQSNQRSAPTRTRKICPVCGAQFPGESGFCGTCGAALVPVN
ncbi:MAG TPA: zinc ribbon domain-containing protein [Polyangiaceae bacterium]|nr:zinc ribbon domain-containing protein [Polyangiaceae bacterium]